MSDTISIFNNNELGLTGLKASDRPRWQSKYLENIYGTYLNKGISNNPDDEDDAKVKSFLHNNTFSPELFDQVLDQTSLDYQNKLIDRHNTIGSLINDYRWDSQLSNMHPEAQKALAEDPNFRAQPSEKVPIQYRDPDTGELKTTMGHNPAYDTIQDPNDKYRNFWQKTVGRAVDKVTEGLRKFSRELSGDQAPTGANPIEGLLLGKDKVGLTPGVVAGNTALATLGAKYIPWRFVQATAGAGALSYNMQHGTDWGKPVRESKDEKAVDKANKLSSDLITKDTKVRTYEILDTLYEKRDNDLTFDQNMAEAFDDIVAQNNEWQEFLREGYNDLDINQKISFMAQTQAVAEQFGQDAAVKHLNDKLHNFIASNIEQPGFWKGNVGRGVLPKLTAGFMQDVSSIWRWASTYGDENAETLWDKGLDSNGNPLPFYLNPRYLDMLDKSGIWDPEEVDDILYDTHSDEYSEYKINGGTKEDWIRAQETFGELKGTGVSFYKGLKPLGEQYDMDWGAAFEMSGYMGNQMATYYLLGTLNKGLDKTLGRQVKAGAFRLSKALKETNRQIMQTQKALNRLFEMSGGLSRMYVTSIPISFGYGRAAYDGVKEAGLQELQQRITNSVLSDQNYVAERKEILQNITDAVDAGLITEQNAAKIYDEAVKELYDKFYSDKQMEAIEDYTRLDQEATDAFNTQFAIESARNMHLNMTVRQWLFKDATKAVMGRRPRVQLKPQQENTPWGYGSKLKENSLLKNVNIPGSKAAADKLSSSFNKIKNGWQAANKKLIEASDGTLSRNSRESIIRGSKELTKNIWGGFYSNYMDDVTTEFSTAYNLNDFNDYISTKYDGTAIGQNTDFMSSFFAGLDSAAKKMFDQQAFYDGLIGMVGGPLSVNPVGALGLFSGWKNFSTNNGRKLNRLELINRFMNNPVLGTVAMVQAENQVTDKRLEALNKQITEKGESLRDVNTLLHWMKQHQDSRQFGDRIDMKDADTGMGFAILDLLNKINEESNGESQLYKSYMENLQRLASMETTEMEDSEVMGYLKNPNNKVNTTGEITDGMKLQAALAIKENATKLLNLNEQYQKNRDLVLDTFGSGNVLSEAVTQLTYALTMQDSWTSRMQDLMKEALGFTNENTKKSTLVQRRTETFSKNRKAQLEKEVTDLEEQIKKDKKILEDDDYLKKQVDGQPMDESRRFLIEASIANNKRRIEQLKEDIKVHSTPFNEDVLSPEQIANLNPQDIAIMVAHKNTFAPNQQKNIEKFIEERESKVPNFLTLIQDAGVLYGRIADTQQLISNLIRYPEAIQYYSLEKAKEAQINEMIRLVSSPENLKSINNRQVKASIINNLRLDPNKRSILDTVLDNILNNDPRFETDSSEFETPKDYIQALTDTLTSVDTLAYFDEHLDDIMAEIAENKNVVLDTPEEVINTQDIRNLLEDAINEYSRVEKEKASRNEEVVIPTPEENPAQSNEEKVDVQDEQKKEELEEAKKKREEEIAKSLEIAEQASIANSSSMVLYNPLLWSNTSRVATTVKKFFSALFNNELQGAERINVLLAEEESKPAASRKKISFYVPEQWQKQLMEDNPTAIVEDNIVVVAIMEDEQYGTELLGEGKGKYTPVGILPTIRTDTSIQGMNNTPAIRRAAIENGVVKTNTLLTTIVDGKEQVIQASLLKTGKEMPPSLASGQFKSVADIVLSRLGFKGETEISDPFIGFQEGKDTSMYTAFRRFFLQNLSVVKRIIKNKVNGESKEVSAIRYNYIKDSGRPGHLDVFVRPIKDTLTPIILDGKQLTVLEVLKQEVGLEQLFETSKNGGMSTLHSLVNDINTSLRKILDPKNPIQVDGKLTDEVTTAITTSFTNAFGRAFYNAKGSSYTIRAFQDIQERQGAYGDSYQAIKIQLLREGVESTAEDLIEIPLNKRFEELTTDQTVQLLKRFLFTNNGLGDFRGDTKIENGGIDGLNWQVSHEDVANYKNNDTVESAQHSMANKRLEGYFDDGILTLSQGGIPGRYPIIQSPFTSTGTPVVSTAAPQVINQDNAGPLDSEPTVPKVDSPTGSGNMFGRLATSVKEAVQEIIEYSKARLAQEKRSTEGRDVKGSIRATSLRDIVLGKTNADYGPTKIPSTNLGTQTDSFLREFFSQDENGNFTFNIDNFDFSLTPNISRDAIQSAILPLTMLRDQLVANGETYVCTQEIVADGTVEIIKDGKTIKVPGVGHLDMMTVDNLGNIRVYDFKTFRNVDTFISSLDGYGIQTNSYAKWLEEQWKDKLGLNVVSVSLIPVQLSYKDVEEGKEYSVQEEPGKQDILLYGGEQVILGKEQFKVGMPTMLNTYVSVLNGIKDTSKVKEEMQYLSMLGFTDFEIQQIIDDNISPELQQKIDGKQIALTIQLPLTKNTTINFDALSETSKEEVQKVLDDKKDLGADVPQEGPVSAVNLQTGKGTKILKTDLEIPENSKEGAPNVVGHNEQISKEHSEKNEDQLSCLNFD